jgi:hypothetical protein
MKEKIQSTTFSFSFNENFEVTKERESIVVKIVVFLLELFLMIIAGFLVVFFLEKLFY